MVTHKFLSYSQPNKFVLYIREVSSLLREILNYVINIFVY